MRAVTEIKQKENKRKKEEPVTQLHSDRDLMISGGILLKRKWSRSPSATSLGTYQFGGTK